MTVHFSPSTGAFHDDALGPLPEDAVPVSDERHAELIAERAAGAAIELKKGKPVAVHPDLGRETVMAAIKGEAARRILAVSPLWRQANDATAFALGTADDAARERLGRITAIRAASDLIEAQLAETATRKIGLFPVTDNPLWPETD